MLKHILRWLVILSVLSMLVVIPVASAQAADLRQADTVVIANGDVINDDLYIASTLLVINGTVNGDLLWAGQTININGKVNGSVTAIGTDINIDGEVTKSVRTAGMTVNVRGKIGGDLMVAGSTIELINTAAVGQDLVFAARKIRVDSLIERSITGNGTEVTLNSNAGADVKVTSDSLNIGPSAKIQGNLTYTSKNEANIQNGANIAGTITRNLPEQTKTTWPTLGVWGTIICFLMALLTGILLIVITPRRAKSVVAAIRSKPWQTLGWGALFFFATPIAVLIACITIIGIPAGLISLLLYAMALYISQVVIGLFIGSWIVRRSVKTESRGLLIGAFAVGLIILTFAGLIPFIGFPLFLATVIFGLGAMFVSERKLRARGQAKEIVISPGQADTL
jgi:cytoskeletal protein CcmA (bactofilin family)